MAVPYYSKHLQESRIATKIRICREIEAMSEEECQIVLEWYGNEFGCQNINQFLIKLLFVQNIDELFTNTSLNNLNKQMNNYLISACTKQSTTHHKTPIHIIKKPTDNNKDTKFLQLMDLPVAIVSHITCFTSKHTVENLQHCNRQLYQTINNISYLDKHKEFTQQSLVLDERMIVDIVNNKRDLFKWSKMKQLELSFDCKDINIDFHFAPCDEWLNKMRRYLMKLVELSQRNEYYSGWFIELLKSIEILKINYYSSYLLSLLPIDILFNKNNIYNCHLKEIQFTDGKQWFVSRSKKKQFFNPSADFEKEYSEFIAKASMHMCQLKSPGNNDVNDNVLDKKSEKSENSRNFLSGSKFLSQLCRANNGRLIDLVRFGLIRTRNLNNQDVRASNLGLKLYPFIYSLNMCHLWIINTRISPIFWDWKHKYHPNLEILTLEGQSELESFGKYYNTYGCQTTNSYRKTCPIDIKHLRLIRFDSTNWIGIKPILTSDDRIANNDWLYHDYNNYNNDNSDNNDKNNGNHLEWNSTLQSVTIHLMIDKLNINSIIAVVNFQWRRVLILLLNKRLFTSLKCIHLLFEFEYKFNDILLKSGVSRIKSFIHSWMESILSDQSMTDKIKDSMLDQFNIGFKHRKLQVGFVGRSMVGVSMLSLQKKDFANLDKKMMTDFGEQAKDMCDAVIHSKLSSNESLFAISNKQLKLFDKLID